ncbi:MAG: HupE/UreJ family protein [Propionibacteriaceae bacterium]|nr:HupE/UreJ family protein [Propionibacteriaceae bacterium]
MNRLIRAMSCLLIAVFALLVPLSDAAAHVRSSTGYSTLRQTGADVHYALLLDYSLFAKAAGLGLTAIEADGNEQRSAALAQGSDAALSYLGDRIRVYADGAQCTASVDRTGVVDREGMPFAELDLVYACHANSPSAYVIRYEVFRPTDAVVDNHDNVVDYQLAGTSGRTILDRQTTSLRTGDSSSWSTAAQFLKLGFHHILAGLDHVLFVLALVLGARGARSLAWSITTFTLAHSVTIGLAALDLVAVPASVVEPLIALSIAFVAFDGVLADPERVRTSRIRLGGVFAFGLLHGLGFAGALRMDGTDPGAFLWSLFTFNVGIELGQALVVVLAVPFLWVLRRHRARLGSAITIAASSAIGLLGILWFIERLVAPSAV